MRRAVSKDANSSNSACAAGPCSPTASSATTSSARRRGDRARRRRCARASWSRSRPRPSTDWAPTPAIRDAVRAHLRGEGPAGRSPGDRARAGRGARSTHWARDDAGGRARARRRVLARPADDDPAARGARARTPSPAARTASACACPSHPVAQALLACLRGRGGRGIAAPSANRFGRISPTTAQHVARRSRRERRA